jgi:hypothetical protein
MHCLNQEAMVGPTLSSQSRISVAGDTFTSLGRIVRNISAGLALSLPMAAAWVQPAQAVLIFNFYESGGNLVVEGTGSLNLPSLPSFSDNCGGLISLQYGFCTGPWGYINVGNITGPTTLGTGIAPVSSSSSDSGIALALDYASGFFGIGFPYSPGDPIFSRSTFSGITLASLGMTTPGTLGTWTLFDPNDSSYVGDTISVQVNAGGSPANVPGPLPILGLAAAFGFSRKLRKRIKRHRETSSVSTSLGA